MRICGDGVTLDEFTSKVTEDLVGAGFTVEKYCGFPLVKTSDSHDEIYRFLKFRTSIPCDRRIYAEGCIMLPAGANLKFFHGA
jgi:hypothetical protein